jgi:GT2 family glycosyltransferase
MDECHFEAAPDAPGTVSHRTSPTSEKMVVRGKFFFRGKEKFWVKGVTYGPFRPNEFGELFPSKEVVGMDFLTMRAVGINTVRTYVPPPAWFLDLAQSNGLHIMVGLAWEQHVAFLDDRALKNDIELRVRAAVRSCNNHPAIMSYAVGNEVPASIIRWHGRRKIEKFIKRLYAIVKKESPEALVTYVNYPTTEYLQLPFLDFCCFNVYLENKETLQAYLARLQNLAWEKPLLIAEIGLDSRRNGEAEQAYQLKRQIETVFESGCAGAVVFAWTDEWYRGGVEIEDWDFGLTTRKRVTKKALDTVREAYAEAPFPNGIELPHISVVVCSYNGARTIRDTLESLAVLDYPIYDVIIVDDGSTDETAAIASEFDFELIRTENRGLSNARNTGMQRAQGEIIAYVDDDTFADQHWLRYLAQMYLNSDFAAVGGQSPAPPGGSLIADCVANAPGRPVHVLLTDQEAEHIPGCNMSFRRSKLLEIGGFDPRYRTAGDDVDVCWRILEQGWKIGFQASAVNWHHCRDSIKHYWNQQKGYGRAEALLEEKWPEKYNPSGHHNWQGQIYGSGLPNALPIKRDLIYQGKWGSAPFQSLYSPQRSAWSSLIMIPEWFLVVALLAFLSLLGLAWPPLLWTTPLLFVAIVMPVAQAVMCATRVSFPTSGATPAQKIVQRASSAFLHLVQPLARLSGRLQHGLTPWRKRAGIGAAVSGNCKRNFYLWSGNWRSTSQWLGQLESLLKLENIPLACGGDFDHWDLEIRGGLLGRARLLMAAEEHGGGKQHLRFHVWSLFSSWAVALISVFGALGIAALLDGAYVVTGILLSLSTVLVVRSRHEALSAVVSYCGAIKKLDEPSKEGD